MPHFTTHDGVSLFYTDEGAGMPLLCLSGLTRTGADFDYLAPHLPPVRLIRLDYRGRGRSGWSGAASYTVRQEAEDALALLDHLGIAKVALIGTSRGGLIGLVLAAQQRLVGLCLNDIGPVIAPIGIERILTYVGRNPSAKSLQAMAEAMARHNPGFISVPASRWQAEADRLYAQGPDGLVIRYDPALREAFLAGYAAPPTDLWPLFDAASGLPLALLRGQNSDLLAVGTVGEMRRRRPDMLYAEVAGRGHAPFLDEPASLTLIHAFLKALP